MTEEFGTLERVGGVSVLRFRRRLAHPQDQVWAALTENEHLAAWFPTTVEGARADGAALHFSFRHGEGEPFDGQMKAFDPPSLMELRWSDDLLRFELDADGSGCVLSLTVTFPEHGKAARDAAGWHVCLDRLAAVGTAASSTPLPADRWPEAYRGYVERLGPEASAVGPPLARAGPRRRAFSRLRASRGARAGRGG